VNVLLTFLPGELEPAGLSKAGVPPLAIYTLASLLLQDGHNVTTIDANSFSTQDYRDIKSRIIDIFKANLSKTDVVCFSSNSFNWGLTKLAIGIVKTLNKDIPIILGGLHPTIFDSHILMSTEVDYIIRGEGEETLPELLRYIQNGGKIEKITGLSYNTTAGIIQHEDTPPISLEKLNQRPAYSLIPNDSYYSLPFETSRGCQYSCAFCSIPHRYNWRGLEIQDLYDNLAHAKKFLYKFISKNSILFVDDCFTTNIKRARDIFDMLGACKDGVEYFIEARVSNLLKGGFLGEVDPRLVTSMQIGVECGYDEGLRRIKKGMCIDDLFRCLDLLKECGYTNKVFLSFILGFPWETEELINKTLATIVKISEKYDITCNLSWLFMLPSDLWKTRNTFNINIDESIFDDPLWYGEEEIFYKVHPLITPAIIERIENQILNCQSQGMRIKYNFLLFSYAKRIREVLLK